MKVAPPSFKTDKVDAYEGAGTRMEIGGVVCILVADDIEKLRAAWEAIRPDRIYDFHADKCRRVKVGPV